MNKFTPILVLHNIEPVNGGLTQAVLLRADALATICKKVIVYTFGYHFDFYGCVEFWKNKLDNYNNIEFLNIFETNKKTKVFNSSLLLDENEIKFDDKNNPYGYRIFRDGFYHRYELYSSSGHLSSIDYFEAPWIRTSKSVFSKQGALIVKHIMDKQSNKIAFSSYFDNTGKPIYSCRYDLNTNKPILYFDQIRAEEYPDLNRILANHLEDICKNSQNPVLFIDKREHIEPFINLPVSKKIFVLHSTHLKYPCDDKSIIDPSMKPMFDNISRLDNVIVLTNLQRQDICELLPYDEAQKVVTITHAQPPVNEVQDDNFHNYIVSSLARYHPIKNLPDAIKAFKLVAAVLPNAIYNIYGYGPQEKELRTLITQLGLEKNVFLKGFSKNVESVYLSSCITLLTSRAEGQGLVISESMAYGVPVVSYETNYGPMELIKDGVNGCLAKKYDINMLADKILSVLLNKELRENLSRNSKLITEELNLDKFKSNWINLLS